ncbi:hypothetical protein BaRGS_00012616, partial [Batillaria attramentaria]
EDFRDTPSTVISLSAGRRGGAHFDWVRETDMMDKKPKDQSTAEICRYTRTGDSYFPYHTAYKVCQWGCCWEFDSPCCSTPVGLIVGCVIGGIVCVSLVVLAVCCCCCRQPRPRNPGIVVSYGNSGVAFNSASPVNQTSSLPPGEYAPPPSYDEVMSGQFDNPAFKPESV